ncbi:MAG: response regulator [Nitrosomonas sp.]|nr:response regulator [Nitrosomonas sp.]
MNNRVILLVEDNPDDVLLTVEALAANRISNKVVVAHNGVEALDYLFGKGIYVDRDITDLPVFVLLDLKLPKIDGLEVLQQIRADERTRLIPAVILTSSVEDKDRLEGYLMGANSYVHKLVDYDDFVRLIGQLGYYWLMLNVSPHGH